MTRAISTSMIGYLKGRTLPVAATSFMEHVCGALAARYGQPVKV